NGDHGPVRAAQGQEAIRGLRHHPRQNEKVRQVDHGGGRPGYEGERQSENPEGWPAENHALRVLAQLLVHHRVTSQRRTEQFVEEVREQRVPKKEAIAHASQPLLVDIRSRKIGNASMLRQSVENMRRPGATVALLTSP